MWVIETSSFQPQVIHPTDDDFHSPGLVFDPVGIGKSVRERVNSIPPVISFAFDDSGASHDAGGLAVAKSILVAKPTDHTSAAVTAAKKSHYPFRKSAKGFFFFFGMCYLGVF